MKYSDKTLEYYNNLRNIGELNDNDINVGTGIVGSPLCGDVMKLQLQFDQNDIIQNAKYKVFGCVSAIASMELACNLLKGKSINDALKIENRDVADTLDLTEIKRHCSVLAKEAIIAAINNYISKKNGGNKQMITVSEKAILKLKELLAAHGKECKGISIIVLPGGCSGVDYTLSYEMTDDHENMKVEELDGIKFFYKEEDSLMIDGVTIDLIENSIGEGFSVTNKNQFACQDCTCKCS